MYTDREFIFIFIKYIDTKYYYILILSQIFNENYTTEKEKKGKLYEVDVAAISAVITTTISAKNRKLWSISSTHCVFTKTRPC